MGDGYGLIVPGTVALPKLIAGKWYGLPELLGGAPGTSNTALSADVLRGLPIFIPPGERIDRVGMNVNVAATAGKVARGGIYLVGADGLPAALVADLGTVAIDSTGDKEWTVADSPPGNAWYYLFELHNEAITVPTLNSASAGVLGRPTPTGSAVSGIGRTFAFAAMPDPFPVASLTYSTFAPLLTVRAA